MLKKMICGLLAVGMGLFAHAATLDDYAGKGCRYDGAVGRNGKPEGQGVWQCRDGRRYAGQFQKGRFHGKGAYSVNIRVGQEVFLEPFNVNSTKLNHMTLNGRFANGYAEGTFDVRKDGKPLFVMKFDKGIMTDAKLSKSIQK
ncbi:hypothetical protein [Neisseria perflava]|uniref:hypothetical protein n=1 Tax=Neisseria perflava TaxID=33053 RepID=UPI00209CB184|nr:hypothetical protein [Neisseria perflava]MCP1659518.1 hypothetical protein [Neisseria perflava]MCP1772530.1 hypothetical protein [Neisseria perflava]